MNFAKLKPSLAEITLGFLLRLIFLEGPLTAVANEDSAPLIVLDPCGGAKSLYL